jgi:hypothetical protein
MNRAKDSGGLPPPKTAAELLDLYYLDARSNLLETAAMMDRIERAEGGADALSDPRLASLVHACGILSDGEGNRAERFLHLFSDPAG